MSELDAKGVLHGLEDGKTLVKPMNADELKYLDKQTPQLENFEFALDDPEQELNELEDAIYDKMNNKNRYRDEFSKNKGIMTLTGHRYAVLQCFTALDLFVERIFTQNQTTPLGKEFFKVFVLIF